MKLLFSKFCFKDNLYQQRELFKNCFPETKGDPIQEESHYLWKFHSFPGETKSMEYAAYIGEEMVGYYAAIPYRYKIVDRVVEVGMVCDVMTSPLHRGKGIFTRMGEYATNELAMNVPFTIGYPIRKEVIPGHLKIGWKIPFILPLYMKFIKVNSLLRRKKISFIAPILNPCLDLYNFIFSEKIKLNYTHKLTSSIDSVVGYEDFFKEWSESTKNCLIKDLPFSKWRYGAPGRHYYFLSVYNHNNRMVGFVSYRKIVKEGILSYGILDYMVLPSNSDCNGFLMSILKDYAKKENVELIMTMMSKTSSKRHRLFYNGFLRSPFTFQLIIKKLNDEFLDEILHNEQNWHLMWVDSDDL